jgi:hypothetical protein
VSVDPFAALGLPARPDLADEQVRAAWRAIAAATHPDRPDGGDAHRYTAAASAYAQLRTPWGRSEAYADLNLLAATADPATVPLPAVPGADLAPLARSAGLVRAIRLLPARVRRGRPLRLVLRGTAAAVLALLAVGLVPGQPAGLATVTGIVTWFLLTSRADLAPPPGR